VHQSLIPNKFKSQPQLRTNQPIGVPQQEKWVCSRIRLQQPASFSQGRAASSAKGRAASPHSSGSCQL
jgi:hypothetical protein